MKKVISGHEQVKCLRPLKCVEIIHKDNVIYASFKTSLFFNRESPMRAKASEITQGCSCTMKSFILPQSRGGTAEVAICPKACPHTPVWCLADQEMNHSKRRKCLDWSCSSWRYRTVSHCSEHAMNPAGNKTAQQCSYHSTTVRDPTSRTQWQLRQHSVSSYKVFVWIAGGKFQKHSG